MTNKNNVILPLPKQDDPIPVVILADGNYPTGKIAASILERAEKVICCDGAAVSYIEKGGLPYAIVGDCDSLPEDLLVKYKSIIRKDTDQETNDLTKGVSFCVSEGFRHIVILGATGKREDHTIGNISLLTDYAAIPEIDSVKIITDRGVMDAIFEDALFECRKGQQVSLFCIDPVTKITTVDLLYPLTDANLSSWWQGTLNQCLDDTFGIKTNGRTIVYRLL